MESPRARNDTKASPVTVAHAIRNFTTSEEDFNSIWHMWQTIFPAWPIERPRLEKILHQLPGHHYIHGKGFCLSYLKDETHGKIAAIGVFPDSRGQGIGTALMERARDGLESESGGELKALEIGSQAPRFWPQMPVDFPQEVKDFFLQRGFHKSPNPTIKDLYKDIRDTIAPPEILDRVSKTPIVFSPWSPELEDECMAKQRATFSWSKAYSALASRNQHAEVMVAIDPTTNAQIGWTLMCSPTAIFSDIYAFLPLMPAGTKTGLISAVGVEEGARGKGVGLALVVRAMEDLKRRGCEGVCVDSVVIRGFYEKLGFETWREYEGFGL